MVSTSPALRFSDFTSDWVFEDLYDISSKLNVGFVGTCDPYYTPQINGVLMLRTGNLKSYGLDINNAKYVTREFHEKNKKSQVKSGDILVARHGSNGQAILVENNISEANCLNIVIIRPIKEVNSEFLTYQFNSPKLSQQIARKTAGSTQGVINTKELYRLNFSIPATFREQQKIADFLSSIDNKISLLKEKHALLTQYKKGVMQKLFKQEIRFKDDNGNAFPDWQIKPLSKLADKNGLKNKDNAVNAVLTNSAKSGIVNQGDYFNKDIANQGNLTGYTVVEKNDFIYNPRISELAPVGPIKRNHIGQGVMSPLYTTFRFKDENVLDYLEQYFNTTMWHRYMNSIANFGARHDRMNITSADFYALPIPLPCEDEREKIVSFIKALETKVNAVNEQIELTKTFKKGLLQQMFV